MSGKGQHERKNPRFWESEIYIIFLGKTVMGLQRAIFLRGRKRMIAYGAGSRLHGGRTKRKTGYGTITAEGGTCYGTREKRGTGAG